VFLCHTLLLTIFTIVHVTLYSIHSASKDVGYFDCVSAIIVIYSTSVGKFDVVLQDLCC